MLNKFYQDCGQWQDAIDVATSHDRKHLRTTHYNHGKVSSIFTHGAVHVAEFWGVFVPGLSYVLFAALTAWLLLALIIG